MDLSSEAVVAKWLASLDVTAPEAPCLSGGEDSGSKAANGPSQPNAEPKAVADHPQRDQGLTNAPLISVARPAMACEFEVLLNRGQYPASVERAMECLDRVEHLETLLSVYRTSSELSTVNRFASQRPIPVSPDTFEMLALAESLFELSGGAFDITAGALSDTWGFSRRNGRMPDKPAIAEAMAKVGTQHLKLDAGRMVSLAKQGVKVNPGGIGKGFALDLAARKLRQGNIASFMMHGGLSSIVAFGDRMHVDTGGGWLVALKHPLRPEELLGTVRLRDQALGTSGSAKQFFHFGGRRYSHIIDPRSGWPAEGMLSATVVCRSGAMADALATALFVLGPQAAAEFCRRYDDLSAILVYTPEKSSRIQVEAINLTDDAWSPANPARNSANP